MYQYKSTIAKALGGDEQWSNLDISTIPLNLLFTQYSRIIVTLTNPFLPTDVAVDLDTIRPDTESLSITIIDFLLQNGNKTLTALQTLPTLNPTYAKYADAFHAGYKVSQISPLAAADAQLPIADKTWLKLNKVGLDYSVFYKNCLVNVNGFFHLTDYDVNGAYVVDGNKTLQKSKQNQIGIYSFREVGQLSFIPINIGMIHKENLLQPYSNEVYVDCGVDVSNKSVMLVLGGYLHVLDSKTFTRINGSTFRIDTANLPMLDRYFESEPYLDFTSLPLVKNNVNPNQIAISEFFSDLNMIAYFTLPQSFFVIIDNPNISVNRVPVKVTPLPNMFISYTVPLFPLVVGLGKLANYWYTFEDGQYSLTCFDSLRKNYLYDTIDPLIVNSVSNACISDNPLSHSAAYMLEVSTVNI